MQLKISRDILLWYVLPIVLFFTLVMVFFYQPFNASDFQIERTETLLQPNLPLQLGVGERYNYAYTIFNQPANATYTVSGPAPSGCMRVRGLIVFNNTIAEQEACLYLSNGSTATNAPGFDFFQPWMLALRPGLAWSTTTTITYPPPLGFAESTTTAFYVAGMEKKFCRNAFKVLATTSQTSQNRTAELFNSTYWVDVEKRVLLEQDSSMMAARIISAPFELNADQTS